MFSCARYNRFLRSEWQALGRQEQLDFGNVDALFGFDEPVSIAEVTEVYLPLVQLLNRYFSAKQALGRS